MTFEFVEAVAAGTTSFAVEGFAAVFDVVILAGDADFNMNAQGDITANSTVHFLYPSSLTCLVSTTSSSMLPLRKRRSLARISNSMSRLVIPT